MEPSFPRDARDIFWQRLVSDINRSLEDFIQHQVPKMAKDKEDNLRTEILAKHQGDTFLDRVVTAETTDTITLLVRFTDVEVPALKYLKFKLLRGEIEIDRYVNLTRMSEPNPVKLRSIPAYAIQLEQRTKNYLISIGGGASRVNPAEVFNQYRVEIDFTAAPLYLKGLLVERDKGGFLIDVNSRTGVCIPLGPGFGLKGIGILYGEHFAPDLRDPGSKETSTARMERATASEYVKWAKAEDLEKWAPTDENMRIYGLTASFCDAFTAGKIIMLNEASVAYIDFGPVIVLGGKLAVLSLTDIADVTGAIDCRSQTTFARASLGMDLIPWAPGQLVVSGTAEVSASLHDQRQTWFAAGGFAMDGCRVKLLGFIELWGGYRVVPLQGAAARGAARLEGKGELLGISGGYSFSLDLAGNVGWNPIEIGGSLAVSGDAWADIWGVRLAIGASALLAIQVAEPLRLKFELEFRLDLPWPLGDKKFPVKVFDLEVKAVHAAAAALDIAANLPIPHIHWASGITGHLEATGGKVWPDVSFELPFIRHARGQNIIVNIPANAGVHDEGGITTTHQITKLEISAVDALTSAETPVPSVHAAWLMGKVGEGAGNSNRLSIPCNDPLGWLTRHETSAPDHTTQTDLFTLQTFGRGPGIDLPVDAATTLAIYRAEHVEVISHDPMRLIAAPWALNYGRSLVGRDMAVRVTPDDPADPIPTVTGYQLRVASPWGQRPRLSIVSGGSITSSTELMRIPDGTSEWCVEVARQAGDYMNALEFGAGEQELRLLAVGYLTSAAQMSPGPRTVLSPGHYRLRVEGTSESRFDGRSGGVTTWPPVQRDFEVVRPPLRPYLRYATCGDERLFGLRSPGWNPNPLGSGFGHYRGHRGLIRSRVSYLSAIYPELWISANAGKAPSLIPATPASEGTIAGSQASQEWKRMAGAVPEVEEELVFDIDHPTLADPTVPYIDTIRVFVSDVNDTTGSDIDPAHPFDEWTYRISRHADSVQHLKPAKNALSRAYGPFGSEDLDEAHGGPVPAGLNFPGTPLATMQSGWALPDNLANQAGVGDVRAGLNFLRIIEWCGVFHADPSPAEDSILDRPTDAEIAVLLDTGRSPVALLIRTDEPCDWRRLSLDLVVEDRKLTNVRFTSRITPSPDGCAAIIMFEASGVAVRIPKGTHALQFTFALQMTGMPRLTRADMQTQKVEQFNLTFTQPFGKVWN